MVAVMVEKRGIRLNNMNQFMRHYEESTFIPVVPETLFVYVDDHTKFSSHMSQSSWMMGGGSMQTSVDGGRGQKVGSHIQLQGKVFGITLFLDEVVTEHVPPHRKVWKTVGTPRLLIIGYYQMGLDITPEKEGSKFTVSIDYELPQSTRTRWLAYLFSGVYAKWCVRQMLTGAREYFTKDSSG